MEYKKISEFKNQLPFIITELESIVISDRANGTSVFNNVKKFKNALRELYDFGDFDEAIKFLKKSEVYSSLGDRVQLSQSESIAIKRELSFLITYLNIFLSIFKNNFPDQSPNSINIKLPEITNFKDLSKVAKDLHSAISQVVINKDIDGKEQIVSVENGSIWINVIIGAGGVSLISSIVLSASVIYNFILKIRQAEEHLKLIKTQNATLNEIRKLQESQIKSLIEAEANYIQTEHFKENLPENVERLKNSIRIFSDLLLKGAQVRPALTASNEIKESFPVNPELVESKAVKKLDKE